MMLARGEGMWDAANPVPSEYFKIKMIFKFYKNEKNSFFSDLAWRKKNLQL